MHFNALLQLLWFGTNLKNIVTSAIGTVYKLIPHPIMPYIRTYFTYGPYILKQCVLVCLHVCACASAHVFIKILVHASDKK